MFRKRRNIIEDQNCEELKKDVKYMEDNIEKLERSIEGLASYLGVEVDDYAASVMKKEKEKNE